MILPKEENSEEILNKILTYTTKKLEERSGGGGNGDLGLSVALTFQYA